MENERKTKHTPAPWEVMECRPNIVKMPEAAKYGHGNKYASCGGGNNEANAKLIAAAPEMLEALHGLIDIFIHTPGNILGNKAKTDIIKYNQPHVADALNAANRAIDKATE